MLPPVWVSRRLEALNLQGSDAMENKRRGPVFAPLPTHPHLHPHPQVIGRQMERSCGKLSCKSKGISATLRGGGGWRGGSGGEEPLDGCNTDPAVTDVCFSPLPAEAALCLLDQSAAAPASPL